MTLSTVFWTVFSGTLVYSIGQIILKFFIEPIHKQREIIGVIADYLIFYAFVYSNPGTCSNDLENDARRVKIENLLNLKTR